MQCKELEAVLEREELSSLPTDAQEHLAECSSCQEVLADLTAIVEAAQQMPAEAEPPQRVWVSLRAQLEAEGIIHGPEIVDAPARIAWWNSFSQLWRPRILATVGAALFIVVAVGYVHQQRTLNTSAVNTAPLQPTVKEAAKAVTPAPAAESKPAPKAPHSVAPSAPVDTQTAHVDTSAPVQPPQPRESSRPLRPSPTEDAYFGERVATMNQMEGAVPARELADNAEVDASFRDNLRTLNAFIAECEARLKQNPKDRLTREYLNMALQQKAGLLTAMMDSGRSEN